MLKKINEKLEAFRSVVRNQKGATMVEYALMLALIAVVAMVGVKVVGDNALVKYNAVGAGKPFSCCAICRGR